MFRAQPLRLDASEGGYYNGGNSSGVGIRQGNHLKSNQRDTSPEQRNGLFQSHSASLPNHWWEGKLYDIGEAGGGIRRAATSRVGYLGCESGIFYSRTLHV